MMDVDVPVTLWGTEAADLQHGCRRRVGWAAFRGPDSLVVCSSL